MWLTIHWNRLRRVLLKYDLFIHVYGVAAFPNPASWCLRESQICLPERSRDLMENALLRFAIAEREPQSFAKTGDKDACMVFPLHEVKPDICPALEQVGEAIAEQAGVLDHAAASA
jgi:hypothetical protein